MYLKPTPVCLKYVEILLNTPKYLFTKTYFHWDASVFDHFLLMLSFRHKLKTVKTGLAKWFMGSI